MGVNTGPPGVGASPRSRGWTLAEAEHRVLFGGFPALAGMDPHAR